MTTNYETVVVKYVDDLVNGMDADTIKKFFTEMLLDEVKKDHPTVESIIKEVMYLDIDEEEKQEVLDTILN
jgi:uncharacterized membrane-anchored protein YjiN (DUF445 family)